MNTFYDSSVRTQCIVMHVLHIHVHVCAVWAIADIVPIHVCTYMYMYVLCGPLLI